MNSSLQRMLFEKDTNKRIKFAVEVQGDIDNLAKRHLRLANRHYKIVEALVSMGVTELAVDDDAPLSIDALRWDEEAEKEKA